MLIELSVAAWMSRRDGQHAHGLKRMTYPLLVRKRDIEGHRANRHQRFKV